TSSAPHRSSTPTSSPPASRSSTSSTSCSTARSRPCSPSAGWSPAARSGSSCAPSSTSRAPRSTPRPSTSCRSGRDARCSDGPAGSTQRRNRAGSRDGSVAGSPRRSGLGGGEPQPSLGRLAFASQLGAQLLLAGQVHLVANGPDLLVVEQRDLRHGVVLLGAEHDPDRLRLVLGALVVIEVVHVHLHLAEILMRELAELEIDE